MEHFYENWNLGKLFISLEPNLFGETCLKLLQNCDVNTLMEISRIVTAENDSTLPKRSEILREITLKCITCLRTANSKTDTLILLCDCLVSACRSVHLGDSSSSELSTACFENLLQIFEDKRKRLYETQDRCEKVTIILNIIRSLLLLSSTCNVNIENRQAIDDFLLEVLQDGNPVFVGFIMVHIIPVVKSETMFQQIWNAAIKLLIGVDTNDIVTERTLSLYIITCSMCDVCFVPNPPFLLETKHTFWNAIQIGLKSRTAPLRKRSMYALKRAIEYCKASKKSVNCLLNEEVIFFWDGKLTDELISLWDSIFLVFEVLEEKQIHVIKPALLRMDRLIQSVTTTGNVHHWCSSWLFCLLSRMLTHETKFVIRWAISTVLKLRLENVNYFSNFVIEFLVSPFLTALNDASVYQRTESGPTYLLIPTGDVLFPFLADVIGKLESGDDFIVKIVHQISQGAETWGGVSLFHITYALSLLPPRKCLTAHTLKELREMICNSLRSQEPILRGAIQCNILTLVWKLVDPPRVTLHDVSHLLSVLRRSECMRRETAQWTETTNWLQLHFKDNITPVNEFCSSALTALFQTVGKNVSSGDDHASPLECRRVGYLFVLLDDAGLVDGEKWEELLNVPVEWLLGAHCRPYLSKAKIQNVLDVCIEILKEGNEDGSIVPAVRRLISPGASNLMHWLLQRCLNSMNVEEMTRYRNALRTFLSDNSFCHLVTLVASSAITHCQQSLKTGEFQIPDTLNAWHILALLWQVLDVDQDGACKSALTLATITAIHEGRLDDLIEKPKTICQKPGEKLLSSSAMQCAWYCLSHCLDKACVTVSSEEGNRLSCLAMDSFQTASHSSAIYIFQSLSKLFGIMNNKRLVDDLAHLGWQTCMEMRHSDLFLPAMTAYIKAFFQPCLMSSHTELLEEKFNALRDLGETCIDVFPVLAQHCLQVWTTDDNFSIALAFASAISSILTFGQVHRKDQRILNDTSSYIMTLGKALAVNSLVEIETNPDLTCRALCVAFLCGLSPDCEEHRVLACQLVDLLVDKDKEFSTTHGRHFANSLIHRVKNRCWQGLLILLPLLRKEKCLWLLQKAYVSMTEEGQQPSVRSLQEWLAARILLKYPEMRDKLMSEMEKYSEYRLGCAGSFLAVVVLLTSCTASKPPENEETLLVSWLHGILPWCMAQHFNTRLYARTAWLRVHRRAQELDLGSVLSQFHVVYQCFLSKKEYRNPSKIAKTLVDNFYYTCFRADVHYTLQTIFYDLLRLLNTSQDEWIEPSLIQTCLLRLGIKTPVLLPVENWDDSLKFASPTTCLPVTADCVDQEGASSHFQKKITPWTQMDISPNCLNAEGFLVKRKGGLVVVASLIDKTPNLGGLCRTCEVFGAAEYVVGSLKYVQDKQFQSLSVTAEKWIPIKEVSPNMLKSYLLEMKSLGFTLVGVEQTTLSRDLTKFEFPKDTLLLLGNEREGLPVDLIQLLDVCVEISQLGVVRSLNVHVSGALLIWEYTRQHLTSSATSTKQKETGS